MHTIERDSSSSSSIVIRANNKKKFNFNISFTDAFDLLTKRILSTTLCVLKIDENQATRGGKVKQYINAYHVYSDMFDTT